MTMTPFVCLGCGAQVSVLPAGGSCPQCGGRLTSLAMASTGPASIEGAKEPPEDGVDSARLDPAGDGELEGLELSLYRIEKFLGRGGMARVYLGTHKMLERPCALKVLHPEIARKDRDSVRRLLAEARAAASLVHRHIVTVHNVGQEELPATAAGSSLRTLHVLHFIEMEYVPGQSLQSLLETGGPLEPLRAMRLLGEACSALAEAHRVHFVHRDFKPSNILVTPQGEAKLADFGLAKRVTRDGGVREHRELAGTPYFMAPELFRGEPATPRSDVYAAGVTLFLLLAGRPPFAEASLERLARQHAVEPVPPLRSLRPEVPAACAEVIERALAKRGEERYGNGGELHQALRQALGSARALEDLLAEALEGLGFPCAAGPEGHQVTVTLPEGRRQKVFVQESAGGPLARRLIKIYSPCAPFDESYCRRALELNAQIPYGSLAIERHQGVPYFVMIETYPRSTCDPEEVRRSLLSIGRWADHVEEALTRRDEH